MGAETVQSTLKMKPTPAANLVPSEWHLELGQLQTETDSASILHHAFGDECMACSKQLRVNIDFV